MTVNASTRRSGPYSGTGLIVAYPFNFKIFEATDLLVVRAVISTGATTDLVIDSDYSVTLNSDQEANPGGNVFYAVAGVPTALPVGFTLTIAGNLPFTQPTDITNLGGFYADIIEDALDREVMLIQQNNDAVSRALQLNIATDPNASVELPAPTAGAVIGWAGDGLSLVNYANTGNPALLATLASSIGSSLIGFIQAGVGAVLRTLQSKARDSCNAFDFMSAAGQAAFTAGTFHADVRIGIQAAMDSGFATIYINQGIARLDQPLLVKAGGTQNLKLVGHRVGTYLAPNAVSIATAPVNINSLIINQNNDGKFSLERIRFWSDLGYTGVGVYAKEGGGSDGSAQCIFSGSMTDLWIDFGTANTGFFRGGLQNYHVSRITAENMKGVFFLDGVGNFDIDFRDISLFNCFDSVIDQTTDTLGSNQVSVSGIHAYSHNRGPLIKLQNCNGWTISDGVVTSLPGNLGTVGLLDLLNCGSSGSSKGRMLIDSLSLFSSAGVGQTADAIILNGVAAKLSGITIDGAANGITLAGANAFDLTMDHIDISNSTSNALRSTGLSTGRVSINDSNLSDSQGYNIVNSVAAAFDLNLNNVRSLNAGLGGNSAFRNIAPTTSGAVRLWNCQIGRDNGSAAAASWVDAGGSGSLTNTDPTWFGVPPTSRETGAQLQDKRIAQPTGFAFVNTATYTVLPSDRDIRVNFAGVCTLTLRAVVQTGEQRLTITTETANTVVSASANVSNKAGAAAATAILAAVAGSSAEIVGDAASGIWRIRMTS